MGATQSLAVTMATVTQQIPRMERDTESSLIGCFTILTNRKRVFKIITYTVVMQLNNQNMHICEYWPVLVKLEACQRKWFEANCTVAPSFAYQIKHDITPCAPSNDLLKYK